MFHFSMRGHMVFILSSFHLPLSIQNKGYLHDGRVTQLYFVEVDGRLGGGLEFEGLVLEVHNFARIHKMNIIQRMLQNINKNKQIRKQTRKVRVGGGRREQKMRRQEGRMEKVKIIKREYIKKCVDICLLIKEWKGQEEAGQSPYRENSSTQLRKNQINYVVNENKNKEQWNLVNYQNQFNIFNKKSQQQTVQSYQTPKTLNRRLQP